LASDVADVYRQLGRRGLSPGSSGNVSARLPDGMVITPSGCTPETLTADRLVAMSLDGAVPGDIAPSSEWPMHAAIYQAFPEAGAIVHTHADACTALACLNQGLPAFHYMVVQFGGPDVRCAPYVTFGTRDVARVAVAALQGRSACLLANHGMVVHAPDAAAALANAMLLETLCRQYLLACSVGRPRLLGVEEITAARERFKTYGQRVVG
jgi:L-fuculose-phosphate aldolase